MDESSWGRNENVGAFNPRNNGSVFHITFYLLIYLFSPLWCVCVFYMLQKLDEIQVIARFVQAAKRLKTLDDD